MEKNERASLKGTVTVGSGTKIIEQNEKDYNNLDNKPQINGVELIGNILSKDLNIDDRVKRPLTNLEIEALIQGIQL